LEPCILTEPKASLGCPEKEVSDEHLPHLNEIPGPGIFVIMFLQASGFPNFSIFKSLPAIKIAKPILCADIIDNFSRLLGMMLPLKLFL
jgi:hypothetical protein